MHSSTWIDPGRVRGRYEREQAVFRARGVLMTPFHNHSGLFAGLTHELARPG